MKRLLAFLMLLVPALAVGQMQTFSGSVVTGSAKQDSVAITAGSTELIWENADATNIAVGNYLSSPGNLAWGTRVVAKDASDSVVTIDRAAIGTTALAEVHSNSELDVAAYTAGDMMGFPVAIPTVRRIHSLTVVDLSDGQTSFKAFLVDATFTEDIDNGAFAIDDTVATRCLLGLLVGTSNYDAGNQRILQFAPTTVPQAYQPRYSNQKLWLLFIAQAAQTPASVADYQFTLTYE